MSVARSARVLSAVGLVALLATGCSAASGQSDARASGAGQLQGMRGVSGTITSVSTATLQVKSAQTGNASIVAFSASTTISDTVAATIADVKAGVCVSARGSSGDTPSANEVAATSVSISEPVNGSCTTGLPGGGVPGGTRPNTPNPNLPSAGPSRTPGTGGFGGGAFGQVTSVSGGTITITPVAFGPGRDASASPATTPASEMIVTSASTTFTKRANGTAASLKAGRCIVAFGATDDAGVTTATQLMVSDPVNGQCAMGRGGFGRPGG